jgi:hypothetical protein
MSAIISISAQQHLRYAADALQKARAAWRIAEGFEALAWLHSAKDHIENAESIIEQSRVSGAGAPEHD